MRPAGLATFLAVALLALPAPAGAAKPPSGVFVGKAGRVALAAAVDSRGVVAYACDGRRLGSWFKGRVGRRNRLSLRAAGRRLILTGRRAGASAARDTIVARFAGRRAVLRRARGRQGLYRSENLASGRKRLGGWIVLPRGRQVGVLQSGTQLATAPTLSTTSLTAGSLVAGTVVAPSEVGPLVVDLGRDGLGLAGTATTSLLGGGVRSGVRWTTTGDDDAFIAFNTARLQSLGFAVSPAGNVLARGGLQITRGGVTTTAVDGFHAARLLDSNRDGTLNGFDSSWQALIVYRDANGNGSMDSGETDSTQQAVDSLNTQSATDQQSQAVSARSTASKTNNSLLLAALRNSSVR